MTRKKQENQRRKPTQARARAKYEAILAAAPRVLLAKGYRGCTTEEIALEADVSIGTLYEYFGNKDDVFAVYLNQQMQRVMGEVAQQISKNLDATPEVMIGELVRLGVSFVFNHHRIFSTIIREIPGFWEIRAMKKLEQRIVEFAELIFAHRQFNIERQEFHIVATMLTNTIVGIYIRLALIGTDEFDQQALVHEILCLIGGYIELRTGIRLFQDLRPAPPPQQGQTTRQPRKKPSISR